jgi:hypothetical protein
MKPPRFFLRRSLGAFLTATLILPWASLAAPEAFEVGPQNKDQLPGGKEADGIIGDFVLRNNRVEAVISANLPLRRANMSTFYGATGITPGCLYDLTLRGENNDQLTIFSPSSQQSFISYVRVSKDGKEGEAVVETVVTSANNNGLYKRHEYRVRDDWQGVLVVTTYRNEGKQVRKGTVDDRWTTFTRTGTTRGIAWADAVDPADKAGYAYGWLESDGFKAPPRELDLQPGQEITFARFVAVGHSPAEAVGLVNAKRGATGQVGGTIKDGKGAAIPSAKVEVTIGSDKLTAYPDKQGRFSFRLPPGNYEAEVEDIGRETVKRSLNVTANGNATLDATLSEATAIVFDIRDESGKSIPCKAQFLGVDGTKPVNLGPNNRAHGCLDQYHSAKGQFRVQVPPGSYRVVVTHGIEFGHLAQNVKLAPGQSITVKGSLKRLVDTRGWVSADYHNHSTPSGDNTCGTRDRLINLAAENIEFAPTTEHNRLFDWRPFIYELGLQSELQTVSGLELTGSAAHYNSFPFTPEPFTQDNGAPVWNKDPRITAATLRDWQDTNPNRWVQINHPDMVANFIDRDGDGQADGGFLGLGQLIDGLEVQNFSTSSILSSAPVSIVKDRTGKEVMSYTREFIWLQLLNQGARYWGVAVSDAHSVHANGVGGWRMYSPSRSDAPAEIDWQENARHAKAGRVILTSGPYLEVQADDGTLAGGHTRASGSINLKVRVQCTDWIDIDRVQVLVNGRQRKDLNFTRKTHPDWFKDGVVKFDRSINVPLSQDAHLIVVAYGENTSLEIGYGTQPQAKLKPCAYNNPIFVDVDGGGFKPNGDTLGWPLQTKIANVEEAKKLLGAGGK